MKIIITGISGALARGVAVRLSDRGHDVIGIDRRPWPDAPPSIRVVEADIRKRPAEDVFRLERPDALVHMATVTHLSASAEERYQINLGGTRRLFEYCELFGIKHAVFVGRHTVYGARPDSPPLHREDEPPLASTSFRELEDLVAADLYAGSALWRIPKLDTAVLRLCYFLGPSRRGTLANFLNAQKIPLVLGYDPLYQFMHEWDAEEAITLAIEHRLRGVFNVAGPGPVPLSELCTGVGARPLPLPDALFGRFVGHFGFSKLQPSAKSHVKYPIVIDASAFNAATSFSPTYTAKQTMEGYRWT